jgi:hypothetical protein
MLFDEMIGSVVYNCCWFSPAQSFSGLSPAGFMVIFYCLRFETPPNLEGQISSIYIPQEDRVARLYPHALGFIFVASNCSQSYDGGMYLRSCGSAFCTDQLVQRALCKDTILKVSNVFTAALVFISGSAKL